MTSQTNSAVTYVLAQTQENIEFLRSVQALSSDDARDILARLTASAATLRNTSTTSSDYAQPSFNMPIPIANQFSPQSPYPPKPSALSRPPPPIPRSYLFKARAIWSYNENGQEPQDLQFVTGDIIEVIDNKNADWWKGRVWGKEGIFPSTYVENIRQESPAPQAQNYTMPPNNLPPPEKSYAPPYQYSQPPPQNTHYNGPPQGGQYSAYPPQGPPPPQSAPAAPVVVVQEEDKKKKTGFLQGKLGNTLAHSAVGGVGFGAGSAVGGGIINAIF